MAWGLLRSVLVLAALMVPVESAGTSTRTRTYTLPTRTKTYTLPTRTKTYTLQTRTKTKTVTLPTRTKSKSATKSRTKSRSRSLTLFATAPPTASPKSTFSPTRAVDRPRPGYMNGRKLTAAIALQPLVLAALRRAVRVLTTQGVISLLPVSTTMSLLTVSGLPPITVTVIVAPVMYVSGPPGLPDGTFRYQMTVTSNFFFKDIYGNIEGYQYSYKMVLSIQLQVQLDQITDVTFSQGTSVILNLASGRAAHALGDQYTVAFSLCPKICTSSFDLPRPHKKFPKWGIAIAVVLPIVFLGLIGATVYFIMCRDSNTWPPEDGQNEPTQAELEHKREAAV